MISTINHFSACLSLGLLGLMTMAYKLMCSERIESMVLFEFFRNSIAFASYILVLAVSVWATTSLVLLPSLM
jgi:hypothetical protein